MSDRRRGRGSHRANGRQSWSEVGGAAWGGSPRNAAQGTPGRRDASPTDHIAGVPPASRRNEPERRPQQPPQPRAHVGIVVGRIVAALVATALVLVSGTAWAILSRSTETASDATNNAGDVGVVNQSGTAVTTNENGEVVPVTLPPIKGTNILLVGVDTRTDANGELLSEEELKSLHANLPEYGGVNTDTIMLIHIPDGGGKATAVSIPRDTWMNDDIAHAPGVVGPYSDGSEGPYRANKINAFYGTAKEYKTEYLVSQGNTDQAEIQRKSNEAGRTMLIKVVQQFTGVKVDHYVEVNLFGFYLLSKAVGGVPVCLLNPTKDKRSGADFPAGHFEVQGSDALSFVRQRHHLPHSDLDRVRRQQAFLAGAIHKTLSLGTLTSPSKLSDLVDAANRSLVLDKNFNLLSFAQQMMSLSSGNVNFTTLPTDGPVPNIGTSALATDPAKVRSFFAALTVDHDSDDDTAPSTTVDPSTITVDVQNGTETAGMAAAVGKVIAGAGFERGQLSDYPGTTPDNQQSVTTVHYPKGAEAAAKQVLDAIGTGAISFDNDVPSGHILIVVGTDMPNPSAGSGKTSSTTTPPTTSKKPSAPKTSKKPSLPSNAINAGDPSCVN